MTLNLLDFKGLLKTAEILSDSDSVLRFKVLGLLRDKFSVDIFVLSGGVSDSGKGRRRLFEIFFDSKIDFSFGFYFIQILLQIFGICLLTGLQITFFGMSFEHGEGKSGFAVKALFVLFRRSERCGRVELELIDFGLAFFEGSGDVGSFGFFEWGFGHGVVGFAEFEVVLEFSEEEVSLAVWAILILEVCIKEFVFVFILEKTLSLFNVVHVYYYFIESLVKRNNESKTKCSSYLCWLKLSFLFVIL